MQTLLQNYSIAEIILFLVIAAVAIRGLVTFFDWAIDRLRKVFDKEYKEKTEKETLQNRLAEGSRIMSDLTAEQSNIKTEVKDMKKDINILKDSNKNDIKAWLTEKHHYFCYEKGWIDYYSMSCCEDRYHDYKVSGGNTFVDELMKDLRALPKEPPQD